MILISHRGNINGPKKELENNPIYIQNAIDLGYQVEIDIWKIEDDFFLGHEAPEFQVSPQRETSGLSLGINLFEIPSRFYLRYMTKIFQNPKGFVLIFYLNIEN